MQHKTVALFFIHSDLMVTECSCTVQSEGTKSHKPVAQQKADNKKMTEERPVKKRRVSNEMEVEPSLEWLEEEVKESPGKDPIGAIIGTREET